MITFSQAGTISAPLEDVFACLTAFERIPQWRTDVPHVGDVSGAPAVGTTFSEEVRFMGKRKLAMRVTEIEPNRLLVIEAQSGMPLLPTQRFTLRADGAGTRVELEVTMRTYGVFRLLEFALPGQLKKIWAQYFANLERLLCVDAAR